MSLLKHIVGSVTSIQKMPLKKTLLSTVANGHNVVWDKRGLGVVLHLGLINQTGQAGTLIAPRVLVGSLRNPPPTNGRLYTPPYSENPGDGEPYEIVERFEPGGDVQVCLLKSAMDKQGTPYPVLEQFTGPLPIITVNSKHQGFFGKGDYAPQGTFRIDKLDVEPTLEDSGYPVFTASYSGESYTPILIGCRHKLLELPPLGTHKQEIISRCEKWGVMPPKFISSLADLGIGEETKPWFRKDGPVAKINATELYKSENVTSIHFEYEK